MVGPRAVLQGSNCGFAPAATEGGSMLYRLTFQMRSGGEWTVPAENWDVLEALIAWKLDQLFGGDTPVAALIRSITVEVLAPLAWRRGSFGSFKTWTLAMDLIGPNSGRLQIIFHEPEAFDEGLRRFIASMRFISDLTILHKKAAAGKNDLRDHRFDAARRMFGECQDVASGLLRHVLSIKP